jgi:hypothetical protein
MSSTHSSTTSRWVRVGAIVIAVSSDLIFIIFVGVVLVGAIGAGVLWIVLAPRQRLARAAGLKVSAATQKVRRGDDVTARVTVAGTHGLDDVEVGVVCTESYAEKGTTTDSDGEPVTTRETSHATAYEDWILVGRLLGSQDVSLTVPPTAPFSYDGSALTFEREVVARGRRRLRLDAEARDELHVLP